MDTDIKNRVLITALFLSFASLLLVSFYASNSLNPKSNEQVLSDNLSTNRGQAADLGTITTHPDVYYGTQVTVRGTVDKSIGTRGVNLSSVAPGNGEILVVSRQNLVDVGGGPGEGKFSEDSDVYVSGKVQLFHLSDIEQQLGVTLNPETYKQYEGKPVIIADAISPIVTSQ